MRGVAIVVILAWLSAFHAAAGDGETLAEKLADAQRIHTSASWQESETNLDQLETELAQASPTQRTAVALMRARNQVLAGNFAASRAILDQILNGDAGTTNQRLRALELLANASLIEQDFEGAYRALKRAIELAPQADDPSTISGVFSLAGRMESMAGKLDQAIAYSEKGVEVAREGGADRDICYALYRLGLAHAWADGHERAAGVLREALPICKRAGDPVILSAVEVRLGSELVHLGKLDEAEAHLEEGLAVGRKAGFSSNDRNARRWLARVLLERNALEQAKAMLLELTATDPPMPSDEAADVWDLLAQIAIRQKDFESAVSHYQSQLAAREDFLDHERTMRLAFSSVELATARREQEMKLLQARAKNAELAQERQRQQQLMLLGALVGLGLIGALLALLLWTSFRERKRLARLNRLDPLTGLYNHSAFFEESRQLLREHANDGPVFCFVAADLDFFKAINDRHGHPAGDEVLRRVAARLREVFAGHGIVGRTGGEEFAVSLPVHRVEDAIALVERCRRPSITGSGTKGAFEVTLSFGVACRRDDESLAAVRNRADAALYWAKARGRDQIQLADDLAEAQIRELLA